MRSSSSRWGVLGLVTLAHTLGSFSILSLAPLSPFLLDSLHLSRAQVGLLLPAIYLGGVFMSLPAGWLTDRLGVRLMLVVGQGLTGTMFGLAALTSDFPALLALLFLSGFGWSVLNPASGKAILDWFQPRERGLAMGVKQTGLTLGGIAAALVLPPLAVRMGWARALWIAASASILSALLVGLAYQTPRHHRAEPPADRPRLAKSRRSSSARGCSSSSAAGWPCRSRRPRSWPTWSSMRGMPGKSRPSRPAASWRWLRPVAPAPASGGES